MNVVNILCVLGLAGFVGGALLMVLAIIYAPELPYDDDSEW